MRTEPHGKQPLPRAGTGAGRSDASAFTCSNRKNHLDSPERYLSPVDVKIRRAVSGVDLGLPVQSPP